MKLVPRLRSVRTKLFVGVLVTSLAAILITGASLLAYDLHSVRNSLSDDLATQAELIGRACTPALQFDDAKAANDNLALLKARPNIHAAAVYTAKGMLFGSYARAGTAPESFPALAGADEVRFSGEDVYVMHRVVDDNAILGFIYLHAEYHVYQRARSYLGIVLAVGGLALVVALLLSLWLQATVTHPILSISRLAQQVVEKGDYSPRANKITDDEIGYLVDAFNRMLGEIGGRTEALEASNRKLGHEIAERKGAEDEVRRLNVELEGRVRDRTKKLEEINGELEAFSYSVSHDLRAPLRAMDGFSQRLVDDYGAKLDEQARNYLDRIRNGAKRMGQLIEDLLSLSRITRLELARSEVDVSSLAHQVLNELQQREPQRQVEVLVWDGVHVEADVRLVRVALENLLGNAWKFSSKTERPRVEFGMMQEGARKVLFVRDNGAGFDMAYADKLFGPFQRLHGMNEFPGTGIGLATVHRIVGRHGGRIWCQAKPGVGATFFFTLQEDAPGEAQSSAGAAA